MKLQRPGFTETTLIYCDYLKEHIAGYSDKTINNTEDNFILWLYKSSGWYDKNLPYSGLYNLPFHNLPGGNIDSSKQEFLKAVKSSELYTTWKKSYKDSISNCDFLIPCIHKISSEYDKYKNKFIELLNSKNSVNIQFSNFWCAYNKIYSLIENKNILVISSFADLISQQYNNGNIKKIYPNFPNINSLSLITFPYTFFNNGPHQNSIETINSIVELSNKINFDTVLISAGSYACLLADIFHKMGKTGISMGRNLPDMFGINPDKKLDFWISDIPKIYFPDGWQYIDYGGYWVGNSRLLEIKKSIKG